MAAQCPNCGAAFSAETTFCTACGYRVDVGSLTALDASPLATSTSAAVLEPKVAETPPLQRMAPSVVEQATPSASPADISADVIDGTSIVLADGEHLWRRYAVTQLRRGRGQGQGTLYVTDSRVVFLAQTRAKATSRASTIIQQTKVDSVTGFGAHVSRKVNIFLVLATILLGLLTLFSLTRGSIPSFVVLLALTAGGVLLIVRGAHRRGYAALMIYSASSQASPIAFGEEEQGSAGRSALRAVIGPLLTLISAPTAYDVINYGVPAEDAERVVSELGALIIDLQTKGSLAAERWGVALT